MTVSDRPPTLADIARDAGVSVSTASRVLAGTGYASPAARGRVTAAADRLGYVPDVAARALARGSGVRLVVLAAGASAAVLDDPYVDRVVGAAARVCAPLGMGVALNWLPSRNPGDLRRLAADRGVGGVVLLNATARVLDAVPTALRGRVVSIGIGSPQVPSVDVDNAGGTEAVVGHLYATGRRRIAMVTGPHWMPCSGRSVTAYRRMMREAGLPARTVSGDFTARRGRVAAREVLTRWPDVDAVVGISDATALGVIDRLRGDGVQVPGDVAVTGFDDIPLAAMTTPALTTATHPVAEIATAAATAALAGGRVGPLTTFPSRLVRRVSA
ncbi:LacI family DNA-binding transcriptional regulator [Micromonospora endolithica]|nr:LacI family DNA-binding transcriptional regulator [Micromonospora endolithica]TWJ21637.1 LacI family transcriptional regulator [Micromonospora endolithica]